MVRIAAASTDGKLINQHFGRADRFYILETDEETAQYSLSDIRENIPVCSGGNHDDSQMRELVKSLSDCRYVLVSRIGRQAENELAAFGITAYEIPGVIGESVDKLIRYIKAQELFGFQNKI